MPTPKHLEEKFLPKKTIWLVCSKKALDSEWCHGAFLSEEAARWIASRRVSLNETDNLVYIRTIELYEGTDV